MKKEELYDAVGGIDENMVVQALTVKKRRWPMWVAAAAVLVLAIGLIAAPWRAADPSGQKLGVAVYPTRLSVGHDDYWQQQYDLRNGSDPSAVNAFVSSASGLLSAEKNSVCSPLNLYLSLGMLAEVTDGATRAQLLALLGQTDLESLRREVGKIWNANYQDSGAYKSVLANSLWLREGASYHKETVERLAQTYYASTFAGQMGSPAYNALLREWLGEQTGDLLRDAANAQEFSEQTVLALASTVYLQARWANEFAPEATTTETFRGVGGEEQVPFMHQTNFMAYYKGEDYLALGMHLSEGGNMFFVLPDGDLSDLLARDMPGELLGVKNITNFSEYVELSLPKFDITADCNLKDTLMELGVIDVFSENADFSPLTEQATCVSDMVHAARVAIDEEGVTAAAMTLTYCGSAMPPEPIAVTFDRPFLFIITGVDDAPLFMGTVCQIGQ